MINGYKKIGTVLLLLAVFACGRSLAADRRNEEQQHDFQAIAAQLDPGGELFSVVSAGRWIDRMLKSLAEGALGVPAEEPVEIEVRERVERIRRFMNRQGISAFRGLGASSVSRPDGRHAVKLFLLRDTVDSNLPFWRGLFGWQPRRLLSLDFVPAGFSMVRAGTVEPLALWQTLTNGVHEAGGAATQARFTVVHEALVSTLGMPVEDLLGSLRDELLIAVRFEKDTSFSLPAGNGDLLTIPAPSFLLVAGTGEDVLRGVVESRLARRQLTMTESVVAGVHMRSADRVMDGDSFQVQSAFASPPGFFVFGSSPAVVEEALLAYRHRNGLVSRPEFLSAFKGLSMVNNGIVYVAPDAAQLLRHWRESLTEVTIADEGDSIVIARILKAMTVFGGGVPDCALIIQNFKHGVMVMGSAGIGGETLLKQAGAVVLGLLDQGWRWVPIPAKQ